MKPRKTTFIVVGLLALAIVSGWGMFWKITVGIAAAADLFLIGLAVGGKME